MSGAIGLLSPLAAQSLGVSARGGSVADAIAKALEFSDAGPSKSRNPRDTVQISDAARAKLKKAQADKAIVERLINELDKRSGKKTGSGSSSSADKAADADVAAMLKANGITVASKSANDVAVAGESKRDAILAGVLKADGLSFAPKSENGVVLTGDPTLDIGIFDGNYDPVTGRMLKNAPRTPISDRERGLVTEVLTGYGSAEDLIDPALKAAIKNGTLKFFRTEDIPGLDFRTNAERVTDSSGKIIGQFQEARFNRNLYFGSEGQPLFGINPSHDYYHYSLGWFPGVGGVLVAWERPPNKTA